MKNKTLLIWNLFSLIIFIIGFNLIGTLFKFPFVKTPLFHLILLGLPVILLIFHAIEVLGFFQGILFIFLSSFVGWLMETWGLMGGTFFGGTYIYEKNQPTLGIVPLSVVLYWAVFIYTGYSLVNSFLYWLGKEIPNIKNKKILLLPALIIFDGLVVTAIDLFMDPIQVKAGAWIWIEGGAYFGVPVGNFVGWFIVTVIVTGIFRTINYFTKSKNKFDKKILLIPVWTYIILSVSFTLSAIKYEMFSFALLGSLLMLPPALINLLLYFKKNE